MHGLSSADIQLFGTEVGCLGARSPKARNDFFPEMSPKDLRAEWDGGTEMLGIYFTF